MRVLRAVLACLLTQVLGVVAFFFVVAAITYWREPYSGRHLFNSLWLVPASATVLLLSYPVARCFVHTRLAASIVNFAVFLPALVTGFMCLAWASFGAPAIATVREVKTPANLEQLLNPVVRVVERSLPQGWSVLSSEVVKDPPWAFVRGSSGLLLTIYGPLTGYRDFYCAAGSKRISYLNEGRKIWMMPPEFNANWSYLNWTFGTFRLSPVEFPARLGHIRGATVYGSEASVVLSENEHYRIKTPDGCTGASGVVMPAAGGSWPSWQEDIGARLSDAERAAGAGR